MNKLFGIVALVGLVYFWLTERDAQATPPGVRTLIASWYGDECAGKLMANGRPFDPERFTCASWDYPLGTKLRVTTTYYGQVYSVTAVVTDRGPNKRLLKTRQLDLSRSAFQALASLEEGLIKVIVEKL